MKKIKISKRNGKYRLVYVPSKFQKKYLRKLLSKLEEIVLLTCNECNHGFMPQKSAVTNALQHVNKEYSLCFDLENFFDSVNRQHLTGKIPDYILDVVLVDGAPRQGLPTSPAVANIAASEMDEKILELIPDEVVYTRYADDLTFSFDNADLITLLKEKIPKIVESCAFKINEKKTHLQKARQGRRIITGIAVDNDLHPTRKSRRKLRAALHQGNKWSANGHQEWCNLNLPRYYEN